MIADALQALAGTDIPLGIVPAGTGNDHAREFGLPTSDPVAAADVIADGWTETIDLGRIRDSKGATKWFGTVAATGFDSLVTDRANRMRWPRGRMRYNLAMLAELSQLRLLPFRLVLDGRDEIVTDLTLAAFGNTRSYGGGMLICPNADPTDGQLDITMVHSASRTRLIRLFPTVYKGTHVNLDEVKTARATTDRRRIAGHQRLRRRRLTPARCPPRSPRCRAHCGSCGLTASKLADSRLSQDTSAPSPPSR